MCRESNKPFYTATVKIDNNAKFNEVCKALRYFDINGKNCRALPFVSKLLSSNEERFADKNMFVDRIPKSDSAADLESHFSKYGEIISCKVCLNSDHESKGYGFVCFRDAADT